MYRSRLLVLAACVLMTGAFGCGPKDTVELRYDRPAHYEISPKIRTLGIAEFGGKTTIDRRWGDIASDRLAAQLDTYNNKYHRYQLVDRKRLKAGEVRWPDARRVALLRLLALPPAAEEKSPEGLPSGDEQWLL